VFHARLGVSLSRSTGRSHEPFSCDGGELLGLEEVDISILKCLNHVRREVRNPQVVVYEAGEGGVRMFHDRGYLQPSYYPHTLQFSRPTAFRVSSGVALRMSSCSEQAHQLFVLLRDEVRQSLTQLLDNRADCLKRGKRVSFTLSSSCSSQKSDQLIPQNDVTR
jgi:hypothetical protein